MAQFNEKTHLKHTDFPRQLYTLLFQLLGCIVVHITATGASSSRPLKRCQLFFQVQTLC